MEGFSLLFVTLVTPILPDGAQDQLEGTQKLNKLCSANLFQVCITEHYKYYRVHRGETSMLKPPSSSGFTRDLIGGGKHY